MTPHSRLAVARVVFFSSCAVLTLVLLLGRVTRAQVETSPAARLADLGLKFDGARSCAASECHGKKGDDAPPTEIGHENNIWRAHDKHHESFDTLSNDKSKGIAQKMKIADAKASAACLSCHALAVPANLQGAEFNLKEGNTCGSCHGPSEKWLKPHAEKGWTEAQRKKADSHDALLKQWGLYDTKPVSARAQICAGCHLAIDADMVVAGHPQPTFELDWFSEIEPKHWIDPKEPYYATKVWLAGQVVCLRDAMHQLEMRAKQKKSPESIKAAYQQAMSHLSVLKPAASIVGLDAGALESSAKELPSAMSDPAANADAIATKAAGIAALANGAVGRLDSVKPDKPMTTQVLAAIANNESMCRECGRFGMDQQALAIASLYNAYARAEKVADGEREALNKTIEDKLMPPEEGDLSADAYTKTLAEVKGKLPK